MPSKLYQYRSIETVNQPNRLNWIINVMETGRLYCSSNHYLNDPLDMQTVLSSDNISDYVRSIDSAIGNREFSSYITMIKIITPLLKMQFRKNGMPNDEIDSFDSEINTRFMKWAEELLNQHNDVLSCARIVCLTETYNNLPMWWFYADERRGICFEFEVDKINPADKLFIFPVKYSSKLHDAVETLHKLDSGHLKKKDIKEREFHAFISELVIPCIHKLSDWNYEKEWRYIMLNTEYFDFMKPSKIILGDKVDTSKRNILLEKAHEYNIKATQMSITKYGFREEIVK
jgi:hypothetical protein